MSDRKLVTIRTISELRPIEGADHIEQAKIDGWWVIVKKGEMKVGDPCIFFEIDSILPEWPEFEFMRRVHFRVKTMRMKGCISQGLALPYSTFTNHEQLQQDLHLALKHELDIDLDEAFHVTKWIPLSERESEPSSSGNGPKFPPFPSFLAKTHQERLQNAVRDWKKELLEHTYEITEKLDGRSFTAYLRDGEFGVCSHNHAVLSGGIEDVIAARYDLKRKLEVLATTHGNCAIQGEVIGPKIQGNKYERTESELFLFDIVNIDDQYYYLPAERRRIIFEILQLPHVPIIDQNYKLTETHLTTGLDAFIETADDLSRVHLTMREGLVFKTASINRPYGSSLSFKVISNKFLLKSE